MSEYQDFLASKALVVPEVGFEPRSLPEFLYPFQREIVTTALRRGRSAIFAECGLGKTPMQLCWAQACIEQTSLPALILAPLAVAKQTVREATKFGLDATYVTGPSMAKLQVSNYERLESLDPKAFGAVVLDESSILKSYSGVTKRRLLEAFAATPYRLACSATPAPNDHLELGNHSEFLSVLSSHQMIARWFINDTSSFGTYRLKGHAVEPYWDWVSSWAAMCALPSDIRPDYADAAYVLPELVVTQHVVEVDVIADRREGMLIRVPELSATSVHQERRRTVLERAKRIAEIVRSEPGESWIIWCDTDYENDAIAALLPDAMVVRGSDSVDAKEAAAEWFSEYGPRLDGKCRCGRLSIPNGVVTSTPPMRPTERNANDKRSQTSSSVEPTCASTCAATSIATQNELPPSAGNARANVTQKTSSIGRSAKRSPVRGAQRPSETAHSLPTTESLSSNTTYSSSHKAEPAPSANARNRSASTSTIATKPATLEDCSAPIATSASVTSATIRSSSSVRVCICGSVGGKILLTKPRIFGWGLNFQGCARMVFAAATFSFESWYQAVRRCWRFGQERPVHVHMVMGATERAVLDVLNRKRDEFERMRAAMLEGARRRQHQKAASGDYLPRRRMKVPAWLTTERESHLP
jgi:hypothetical protein